MTENTHIICWNCTSRVLLQDEEIHICDNCDVELQTASEAYPEDKPIEIEELIEIKFDGDNTKSVKLIEIKELLDGLFSIKQNSISNSPIFIVEQNDDLSNAHDILIARAEHFLPGMKPIIQYKFIHERREMVIHFNLFPKPREVSRIFSLILLFLTFISIFLAGIYNFSEYKQAAGGKLLNAIFEFELSASSFVFAIQFTVTLISILIIKDFKFIKAAITRNSPNLISYFIPAPPSFELGTLGSFVRQGELPKNRKIMFNDSFIGPVIAWITSIIIFVYTLPWSTVNPEQSSVYATHSVIFNHKYLPSVVKIILKFYDLDAEVISLHPITLASLAGIYFTGMYLIPASHLNGGHLLKSVSNDLLHFLVTYLMIVLIYFVQPFLAFLLAIFNIRFGVPLVLNNIDKPPRSYYLLFIISLIIATISFPIQY